MSDAMSSLGTRALMQELRMNVLANNLANINTLGFKQDMLSVAVPEKDEDSSPGAASQGSRLPFEIGTRVDFSPGEFRPTGNDLDLAIDGEGFFCVETATGTRYTRKGNFSLNALGEVVTQEGWPVIGEGGKLTVTGTNIRVDEAGKLFVDDGEVGGFKIVNFEEPGSLEKVGDNYFKPVGDAKPGQAEDAQVRQGFVELSNVNAVKMMAEMIDTVRGYESYQKMIQTINEITSKSINEVGRLP